MPGKKLAPPAGKKTASSSGKTKSSLPGKKSSSSLGKTKSSLPGKQTSSLSGKTKSSPPGKKTSSPPKKRAPVAAATEVREKLGAYRAKRDFAKTREPSGAVTSKVASKNRLRFVIQKHAATHLHFDLRFELDGVMKSWAVPKGPSLDPANKRLAMEVEDHPIDYNAFEGTIPKGQYGGGTVMLWDRGTYTADEATTDTRAGHEDTIRSGYRAGKIGFSFQGERLTGSFALVRTRRDERGKAQWLLIKHRDGTEVPGSDIVTDTMTSVATGRTMEEIATGESRVWQSNRSATSSRSAKGPASAPAARAPADGVRRAAHGKPAAHALAPMLASTGDGLPEGDVWVFEPKFDGIRLLAYATPSAATLVTRNGNDKTAQFPEIATAVRALAARRKREIVLDGEAVAMRGDEPLRFQELQGRMHVTVRDEIARHTSDTPTAFFVFDCLVDGSDVLVNDDWRTRRNALEKLMSGTLPPGLRLSNISSDGASLLEWARTNGWEGVIAKRTDSRYEPGHRSRAWLKIKLEHRQEFVVGGWTEPRNSRAHLGALLLGYYDGSALRFAGQCGGGFSAATLADMQRRLAPLERATPPFATRPRTTEPAHWTEPRVVVEVRFTEWTSDGKLRHPIFLGVREDKNAREVTREQTSAHTRAEPGSDAAFASARSSKTPAAARIAARADSPKPAGKTPGKSGNVATGDTIRLLTQLEEIESGRGEGALRIGSGTLDVTSLGKVFFPKTGHTKGDLMRFYACVADAIVPATADRPLVLKRYPNGVTGQAFYQQHAPAKVPPGVRTERVNAEDEKLRLVGGNLLTLLYTVQLGAISVDPWHTRVTAPDSADYAIIDLDPGEGVSFARIVEVAQVTREVLQALGLTARPKTSGASGMHIVIPLPADTPEEAARLIAELVATRVVERAPKIATIVRSVSQRPKGTVYVDFLQNIRGKTVAGVYSVRARETPTVSTPLEWDEVNDALTSTAFTIDTVPARIRERGDLWADSMRRPNSLATVLRK